MKKEAMPKLKVYLAVARKSKRIGFSTKGHLGFNPSPYVCSFVPVKELNKTAE